MRYIVACLFFVTCFALPAAAARAATYQVGPTRTYTKLQDVAPLLAPGDLFEVDGNATYAGPPFTLLAPGAAAASPSDGLIDIGAYEYAP